MMTNKRSVEKTVRDIRRATRRHYSAEEKIRIVLEGLRGENSIAELCRREGINSKPDRVAMSDTAAEGLLTLNLIRQ
jgi:transposase-like protein